MRFDALGLSEPLLKAVTKQGYTTPSPIQMKAIPAILSGSDVMAAAQTGTGKTAGFTLPLLELLTKGPRPKTHQVRALILTPTRELAAQIEASVVTYGCYLSLRSTVVFGGVKINPQKEKLRQGVDILVATPGRLLDLYQQKALRFDHLEVMIFDEADRMLDMGFIHDIRKILAFLPKNRQNLLFSATFSNEIRTLAKSMVNQPVEISVSPRNTTTDSVKQWICPVDKKRKAALLIQLIKDNKWQQVLVFSRTKHGANRLARRLEKSGIKAAAIHGDKTQNARTKALANFKNGTVKVLVATDIAARGLDIEQLPQVVNIDLPNVAEDYVHRIGRTGRAGNEGQAVSLVSADEVKQLGAIERLIKQVLVRKLVDGFEPEEEVAVTGLKGGAAQQKRASSNTRRPSRTKRGSKKKVQEKNKSQGNANQSANKKTFIANTSRKQRKRHKNRNKTQAKSDA